MNPDTWINPADGCPAKLTYVDSEPRYSPLTPPIDPALTKLLFDALRDAHTGPTQITSSMWSTDAVWNRISIQFDRQRVQFDAAKLVNALRPRRLTLWERLAGRVVV